MPASSPDNYNSEQPPAKPAERARTSNLAWAALLVLIVIGELILWFGLPYGWDGLPDRWRYRSHFLVGLLAVLPFTAVPAVRRTVAGMLDRLRGASPKARRAIPLLLGLAATALALWRVTSASQPLYPMLHDEHSYLLQAQHLARLRLWMPAHPLSEFFESFHILVEPVYASIYWPGTGLFNAWGVWLALPHFVIPLALYGAVVALACLVATKATDAAAGALAGLMIAAQPHLAAFSTLVMPQVPTTLLGAALLWAFLRWRSAPPSRRLLWVAIMGVLAGWMAVTRPVDALSFAMPIGTCVLIISLRRRRIRDAVEGDTPRRGHIPAIVAVGVAAALPFLALQVVLNYGTTGNALHPPYVEYLNRFQPGTEFAAGQNGGGPRQVSDLLQKQELYESFVVEELRRRREEGAWSLFFRERLPMTAAASLASLWLLPLPLVGGLIALGLYPRRWRREIDPVIPRLAVATIVLFLLFYAANPFFLSHYALPLAVPATLLAATGIHSIGLVRPQVLRGLLQTLIAGTLAVGLVLGVLHYHRARPFAWLTEQHDLEFKYDYLPGQLAGRTLVLVRYTGSEKGESFHWEPVYNSMNAWPDDADVVWAHDLAGRREQILAYFAERQPDRFVILWNRSEGALYDLGRVNRALIDQRAGLVDQMIRDTPDPTTRPAP